MNLQKYDFQKDKPVYIFGAKYLGRKLAEIFKTQGYSVVGFIDNNKEIQGTTIDGLKVFHSSDVSHRSQIVIASITYVYPIQKQLEDEGFIHIISYPLLTLENNELFPPEPALDGLRQDVSTNISEYNSLKFCDDESYKVLRTLIDFRKTYDFSLLNKIKSKNEYFESFIPDNIKIFVDGGAFDGETAKKYIEFVKGNYEKIYLFEPDVISFEKARENLVHFENIEFYNCGLYSANTELSFNSFGELGSSISKVGNCVINCKKLDEITKEKAFIKLDVEGAEPEALKGAEKLLKIGSPLAICVYHKPSHIWQIPQLIKSINPDYRFYLRHYSDSVFDTILYGVIND